MSTYIYRLVCGRFDGGKEVASRKSIDERIPKGPILLVSEEPERNKGAKRMYT